MSHEAAAEAQPVVAVDQNIKIRSSPRETAPSPQAGVQSSSPASTKPKESSPRELSASRSDIGLEDLTEDDLKSSGDTGDHLERIMKAEELRPHVSHRYFFAVVHQYFFTYYAIS